MLTLFLSAFAYLPIEQTKHSRPIAIFGLMLIVSLITCGFCCAIYGQFGGFSSNLLVGVVCIGASAIISGLYVLLVTTRRYTKDGAKLVGEVLGCREFIKTVEKPRIEALVNETPLLFYNVLPYAYALGITETWIKKFEGITTKQPNWLDSDEPFNVYMMASLTTSGLNIISSHSSSSSSGSSGGSTSGGGGGGGGGGSW